MKVINGVIHYTATEISQLCGKSTQMIKIWSKTSDELEAAGKERLIPAPHIEPNGYHYWSADDAMKIVAYAGTPRKERYGNLKVNRGD